MAPNVRHGKFLIQIINLDNESFIIRINSFEMYKYQRPDCVVNYCSECTWVIP